jgi:hypothetical protein
VGLTQAAHVTVAGFVFPMCLELGTAVVGAKAASGSQVKIYSTAEQAEFCSDVWSICTADPAEKVCLQMCVCAGLWITWRGILYSR